MVVQGQQQRVNNSTMNSLAAVVVIVVTSGKFSRCRCNCPIQDSVANQTFFWVKIFVVMSSYHTIWGKTITLKVRINVMIK
jgi:hypothetical protein